MPTRVLFAILHEPPRSERPIRIRPARSPPAESRLAPDRFCRQIHCIHNAGNCTRYVFFIMSKKRSLIVEITAVLCRMALTVCDAPGRQMDYNTAPHFIYSRKLHFDKEQFLTDIRNKLKTVKQCNCYLYPREFRDKNGRLHHSFQSSWLTSSDTSSFSGSRQKHLNFWSRKKHWRQSPFHKK